MQTMTNIAGKSTDADGNQPRVPVHQKIYEQLREAVLFGDFAPGEAVTIQGLTERTGAGMTPIREAIRRLTSEGALEFRGNRRVVVPRLTAQDIEEIAYLRTTIEPELASRAAIRAHKADIDALQVIDQSLDEAISHGDVGAYLRRNHSFHTRLYGIADAPILSEVAGGLWLRFGPSMRVVCGRLGTQNLPDNHKKALDALRKADAQLAREAIREDADQGMGQLRAALENAQGKGVLIDL